MIDDATLHAMIDNEQVNAFRERGMTPDAPSIRGTAQNPDTFFQAREASNLFYQSCPDIVADKMAQFAELTGREYRPFDYYGHPQADDVIVVMGSASSTVKQAVDHQLALGQKVGVITVHLYRPFSLSHLIAVLPTSVARIAVLDRTKEPGALGEPLYLDVMAALQQAVANQQFPHMPAIVGGRYGLSSKEFTPSHAAGIFNAMIEGQIRHPFTVGIVDDITHLSLPQPNTIDIEPTGRLRALFYGLGADGTVSANKNTIKILGENTPLHTQGILSTTRKNQAGSPPRTYALIVKPSKRHI